MVYKSRGVDINHELKSPGIEVEVNKDTIRWLVFGFHFIYGTGYLLRVYFW